MSEEDPRYLMKYMNLPKLFYLLNKKKLFFTRADNFEDKFEGFYADESVRNSFKKYIKDIEYIFYKSIENEKIDFNELEYFNENVPIIDKLYKFFRNVIVSAKELSIFKPSKDFILSHKKEHWNIVKKEKMFYNDMIVNPFKKNIIRSINNNKKTSFISCWHNSNEESEAMWKIYGAKHGVAIKVNFEKLKKIIRTKYIFYYGNIEYDDSNVLIINFTKTPLDNLMKNIISSLNGNLYTKRKCYEHEKEFRFMIYHFLDKKNEKNFIEIDFENYEFIEEIIISPFLPIYEAEEIKNSLEDLIYTKNITIPIKISKLNNLNDYINFLFQNL